MHPLIQLQKATSVFVVALVCVGLLPTLRAVNPPPDGGYGGNNTAEGTDALFGLTSGVWNVAVGFQALHSDTIGNQNTAVGYRALFSNFTGDKSTAFGSQALYNNIIGNDNVANGFSTLYTNTTGNRNTGNGYRTLLFNNGDDNTAVGWNTLFNNRTGNENTATGSGALFNSTATGGNTANGFQALFNNIGSFNTALGFSAGVNQTTGSNNIYIGDIGVSGESNVIRIGALPATGTGYTATYIAGVYSGFGGTRLREVFVDEKDQIVTAPSSRRYKDDIKPMNNASEALFGLKPVTFRYKQEIDPSHALSFGLIAEEVAEISADLITSDKEGKPQTVRYEAVNAMLLNEFLKEHRKVQEQEATIAQLKKDFGAKLSQLTARLDEQASQIQKVSAQLEASKPAPQVVNNP